MIRAVICKNATASFDEIVHTHVHEHMTLLIYITLQIFSLFGTVFYMIAKTRFKVHQVV